MQSLPMFFTQPSFNLFCLWNAENTFFPGQVVTFTFASLQERKTQSHPACHPSTMWRKIAPSLFSARSLDRGILPSVNCRLNCSWSTFDSTYLTEEGVADQFLIDLSKETVLSRPASLSHMLSFFLPTAEAERRVTSWSLKAQKTFLPLPSPSSITNSRTPESRHFRVERRGAQWAIHHVNEGPASLICIQNLNKEVIHSGNGW